MRNKIICLLSVLIIFINVLVGYYLPPSEMLTTIIVLPIITFCIYRYFDIKPIYKMLFVCLLIIVNDLGVKFYGGGSHDQIGQFLINSSSIIGVFLAYIVFFISTIINIKNDMYTKQDSISSLILFPLIQIVYFFFAWNVGLGRYI